MSNRLTLQDLVDLLAEKKGLTKKDSELFLRELFAVVVENIELKDSVRIKDFGTFKLIKVNCRKSVDVNTGKDIEIPAHYKLGFTPDKSLRDKINAPFAHFETTLLKDGVDLNDTEEVVEVEQDAEVEDDAVAIEPILNHVESLDVVESEVSEPLGTQGITEIADCVDEVISKDVQEVLVKEEKDDKLEVGSEHNLVSEVISSELEDEAKAEEELVLEKDNSTLWIAIIVLVILLLGGLYYFRGEIFKSEPKAILVDSKAPEISDTLSIAILESADSTALQNDTITEIASNEAIVLSQPLDTIQIRYGDTMRKLGLKYYGNRSFWVYIYQENTEKIKDFNNVPLGTELIIPAAEKYGIDAKSKESLAAAQKLEAQYLAN